ncbi:toprim domain-containing protein [Salinisphaera sp. G21_0]|uniref:toprim domain-containing protein n=1 Tax=Salinisphaera sp. G21_0 TaxID=2821094 RepID=UPI001ADBF1A0|nr:toprim domain-containing protein [Salinisphaera sp. G21_0]MBO9482269.1 toprim domain-containing protein [Salinisphaera sp. G21_0]
MKERFSDYKDRVGSLACGNWADILQSVCGLTDREVTPSKSGIPCPHCGGVDRYEFKSPENGYYLRRGCKPGDGFSMIMKIHGERFPDAIDRVARYLGIEKNTYRTTAEARAEQERISRMLEANKVKREQQQEQREVERLKRQEQAARTAAIFLEYAKPADPGHPYLRRKMLPPEPLGVVQSGEELLIPLFEKGHRLVNLEKINPKGEKRGLEGGQRKGVYHRFGGDVPTRVVYISEGWATGASLYLMGQQKVRVYAAMGKGNLEAVARIALEENRESAIVVAADNDKHKLNNPGLTKAKQAAEAIGGDLVLPLGVDTGPDEGVDFSDYFVASGGKCHVLY